MRRLLRDGLYALVGSLLALYLVRAIRTDIGASATMAHAAPGDVPSEATHLRWFLPGLFSPHTFIEFTIEEEAFHRWVKNRRFPALSGPHEGSLPTYRYDQDSKRIEPIEIRDAVWYRFSREDRGTCFAYDRTNQRAHYWSHSR